MTASSPADVVSRYVDDLNPLAAPELPKWLTELGVPPGWRIARTGNDETQPSRIAVGSQHLDDVVGLSCETISVFRFTGIPPVDILRHHCDCTLRELNAHEIETQALAAPQEPGTAALRSSGYFEATELRIWAQHSTYLRGSNDANQGRLVLHSVFVEASALHLFGNEIVQLSDAVHHAFFAMR